jgi:hypothetical protein
MSAYRRDANAERMASLAVREHNEERVLSGLLAAALDNWRSDYRDNLIRIGLLHDAATRVTGDPERVFERAALLLPPVSAE